MNDHECFGGWQGYAREDGTADPCPVCQPWAQAQIDGQVELVADDPRRPFPLPPRRPDGRVTIEQTSRFETTVAEITRGWTDEELRGLFETMAEQPNRTDGPVNDLMQEATAEMDRYGCEDFDSDISVSWRATD